MPAVLDIDEIEKLAGPSTLSDSHMTEEQREEIIRRLRKGEDLSSEWARILFPPEKREYELVYFGKERAEDVIASTLAKREGQKIVAEFTDAGISGAKGREHRPGLNKLLDGVTRHQAVLSKRGNSSKIHAGSVFIWRIPANWSQAFRFCRNAKAM